MALAPPLRPTAPAHPESALVTRARKGDVQAQEELVARFRRSVYLLALQLLGNPDDALDVTQDTLLRFLMTLNRFDVRRPVRPWLYQIVRNRVLDLHRRNRVRRHDSLDEVSEDGQRRHEPADERVDLDGHVARIELRERIWRALDHLSDDHREILVLRDYQDLSYAEIAETLSIPVGTVMSRLHGARKKLREILRKDPSNGTDP